MGSFNRKSEFRRPENLNKPIAKGEKYNISDGLLLREFWRNNHAHVNMTVEADSLTTDAKQILEDYGVVKRSLLTIPEQPEVPDSVQKQEKTRGAKVEQTQNNFFTLGDGPGPPPP